MGYESARKPAHRPRLPTAECRAPPVAAGGAQQRSNAHLARRDHHDDAQSAQRAVLPDAVQHDAGAVEHDVRAVEHDAEHDARAVEHNDTQRAGAAVADRRRRRSRDAIQTPLECRRRRFGLAS